MHGHLLSLQLVAPCSRLVSPVVGIFKVVSMLLKKACCAAPDLVVDWKLAALDSPTDDRLVIRWEDAHCRRCRTEYEFDQIVRLDLTTLDVLVRMKKVM